MICKLALGIVLLCAYAQAQRGTFDLVDGQPSPLRPNYQYERPQNAPASSPYQQTRFRRDVATDDIPRKQTLPAPGVHQPIPATLPLSDPVPKQPRTRRESDIPQKETFPTPGPDPQDPTPATSPLIDPVPKQNIGRQRREVDDDESLSSEVTSEHPRHDELSARKRRDLDGDSSSPSEETSDHPPHDDQHDEADETSELPQHDDHHTILRRDAEEDSSSSEESSKAPKPADQKTRKRRDVDDKSSEGTSEHPEHDADHDTFASRKRRDIDNSTSTEDSSEVPPTPHQGQRERRNAQQDKVAHTSILPAPAVNHNPESKLPPSPPPLAPVAKDPRFRRQAEDTSEETTETQHQSDSKDIKVSRKRRSHGEEEQNQEPQEEEDNQGGNDQSQQGGEGQGQEEACT